MNWFTKIKKMNKYFVILFILLSSSIYSFWDYAHMNSAEDAVVYMETQGTTQQRWVADYFKAKLGGRTTGTSGVDADGEFGDTEHLWNAQFGFIGNARGGAVVPDYNRDFWWDDTTAHNWKDGILGMNFTAYSHFMNLLLQSDEGANLITNTYNNFDGYSYNQSYGFEETFGNDAVVAMFMNNAVLTIDLPNCTNCDGTYTYVPNGNPVVDYKQNGSKTKIGNPHGSRKLGSDGKTNYNCYSDSVIGNCPDVGDDSSGTYQIPNKRASDFWEGDNLVSDQDWAIMEPADNAATFYYYEAFLEGLQGRDATFTHAGTFNSSLATGAYYSILESQIQYIFLVAHYAGDMNAQVHIWSTLGFNHSDYEEHIDNQYGHRTLGASGGKNWESYNKVTAYLSSRANHYKETIEFILTENAFHTYLSRFRSGYNILSNSSDYTRVGTYGVNQAITSIVLIYEKGIMDLRKYRE